MSPAHYLASVLLVSAADYTYDELATRVAGALRTSGDVDLALHCARALAESAPYDDAARAWTDVVRALEGRIPEYNVPCCECHGTGQREFRGRQRPCGTCESTGWLDQQRVLELLTTACAMAVNGYPLDPQTERLRWIAAQQGDARLLQVCERAEQLRARHRR